jgi:hypothetical protein
MKNLVSLSTRLNIYVLLATENINFVSCLPLLIVIRSTFIISNLTKISMINH